MKAIMPWRVLYVLIVMLMISSCCSYFFLTVIMGSTVFIIIIKLSLLCMFIYLQTLKRWRDILSFKMWADELGVTRTDLVLLIFYSPLNDIYTWLAKKLSLLSPSVCKWSTRLLKRWLVSSIPTETFSWTLWVVWQWGTGTLLVTEGVVIKQSSCHTWERLQLHLCRKCGYEVAWLTSGYLIHFLMNCQTCDSYVL